MTTDVVAIGTIADRDGFYTVTELRQGELRPELHRLSGALPSTEYLPRQARVSVTFGHNGPQLGRLEHLERTESERLLAVAAIYEGSVFDTYGADGWHFSPSVRYRGDGREIQLDELALTPRPASGRAVLGAVDIHNRNRRGQGWRCDNPREKLLERAAASARSGGSRLTIHDTRAHEPIPMGNGAYLVDGELVTPLGEREDGRPAGAMRWRPCGPILSVR